jgi:protein-disulfide isomerase
MKPGALPELAVLGKDDAPVTIVEYADLTCPACAAFHKIVLPQIKEKYIDTGRARLIFREFPTNAPSLIAFMLVRCVEPEKTFSLVSELFSRQDEWRSAKTLDELRRKLSELGKEAGLTPQAFNACVPAASGSKLQLTPTQQKLVQDLSSVRDRAYDSFGVDSTPTFFVNGEKLVGARDLEKAIGEALSR